MKFRDYYNVLGVERTATQKDIKLAYRRLARKYHPDVSKEPDAEQRFKEMKEAYEVLKDEEKRAAYDKFGENWKSGQNFQPPPDWEPRYSTGTGDVGGGEEYSDFFESLFGRARSGAAGGRRGFENFRMDGEDVTATISVSIEDAYRGATRQISFATMEADASGRPVQKERRLNVAIPKGIMADQRIRLEKQGGKGIGKDATPGDLYLRVQFEPHTLYRAEGRDIYLTLPVSPWEAALGRQVKAPTLGGAVDLRIPAGSSSGKRLRLKGRGLPGDPPGDQYVELQIVVPKKTDAEEQALYEKLADNTAFNPREQMGV